MYRKNNVWGIHCLQKKEPGSVPALLAVLGGDGIAKACLHRGYEEAASGTEGEAVSGIVSGTAGSFVW